MGYATLTPLGSIRSYGIEGTTTFTLDFEFQATLDTTKITYNLPALNPKQQFTFNSSLTRGSITGGNQNNDVTNNFYSSLYSIAQPIDLSKVPFNDYTNYYNLFCCKFGNFYLNLFGIALQSGLYVDALVCVTEKQYNIIPSSDFYKIASSNLGSTRFARELRRLDKPRLFFFNVDWYGTEYIDLRWISKIEENDVRFNASVVPYECPDLFAYALPKSAFFEEIGEPEVVPDNPFPPPSEPDGGDYEPDPSQPTGEPDLPDIGVTSCGLVNVYNPSAGELSNMGEELFPDFSFPEPSTAEGLEGILENIYGLAETVKNGVKCILNKGLIDYVVDCHIIPVAPIVGNRENIKVGHKTLSNSAVRVINDYIIFDCGAISVNEVYGGFLDYVGTRIKMYIPFIGFVDVNPNWCMGGSIRLKYHFNVIDGSFIAFLVVTSNNRNGISNSVVASYGGNCSVHLPLTGTNYSSMISGIVSSGTNLLSANNVGSVITSTLSALNSTPSVSSSNGYNSGMAFMSFRKPYIMIQRPVASFSENYPKERGIPLNVTMRIGDLQGFTTCENVVFTDSNIMDDEQQLIRSALKEGIIL